MAASLSRDLRTTVLPSTMLSLTQKIYQVFYSKAETSTPPQNERSRPKKSRHLHLDDNLEIREHPRPSYICQLPLELLAEVFQFYVNSEGPNMPFPSSPLREPSLTSTLSSPASPFILSRVCWTWRHLSLAMPTLWSSLAVYRPRLSQLEAIQIWLERSGNRPLYLYIHQPFLADPELEETMEDLLLLLADHAPQWRHFCLKIFGMPPPRALLRLPFNSFSGLESVELGFREEEDVHAWVDFYKLPSLRRVTWDASCVSWALPKLAPWHNLTHVKLPRVAGMTVDGLLKSILYCVELVDLELAMTMPLGATPPPPTSGLPYSNIVALKHLRAERRDPAPTRGISSLVALGRSMRLECNLQTALQLPIDLPKLRHLKIHAHERDAAPLLNRLKLPALTSLHILHYITSSVPPSTAYITELLERSFVYKLETLSIYDPDLPENEIVGLLTTPRLRSLRELELLVSSVTDSTIELLTHVHTRGVPRRLPDLRSLVLPDCLTSDGLLSKMVVSRRPALATMEFSVAADTPLKVDVATLRKLAAQSSFCLSVL